MQLGGLEEHCQLPQPGLGEAEIEFGAFYPYNVTFGGSNLTNFPESYCEAPLGARPKAGASLLASPEGRCCVWQVCVATPTSENALSHCVC